MANVEKFKYWCNKILPLVYDDSLSYYEFLGKVYEKLNETIDAVNSNTAAVAEFDQRINDFIAAETAAREGWEDQQERDRQSWETQQAQKWSAFQAMFISEYDPSDVYVKGDLCSVQYKMYVAKASTTGTFDPTKWDEIVLSDYLAEYVTDAKAEMQAQYDGFLADYQRDFGIVDCYSSSATDAISALGLAKMFMSGIKNNLIDYKTLTPKKQISSTGVISDAANNAITGYIDLTGVADIYGRNVRVVCFFDSSDNVVAGGGTAMATAGHYTVPEGATKCRLTLRYEVMGISFLTSNSDHYNNGAPVSTPYRYSMNYPNTMLLANSGATSVTNLSDGIYTFKAADSNVFTDLPNALKNRPGTIQVITTPVAPEAKIYIATGAWYTTAGVPPLMYIRYTSSNWIELSGQCLPRNTVGVTDLNDVTSELNFAITTSDYAQLSNLPADIATDVASLFFCIRQSAGTMAQFILNGVNAQAMTVYFRSGTGSWFTFKQNGLENVYNNKRIAWLGDSVVAGSGTPTSFASITCDYFNATFLNYGNWSATLSANERDVPCIADRISELPANADIIAVSGGTNDWYHTDAPLGTITDTTTATFYGALNYICNALITKYPDKQIFFTTPIKRVQSPYTTIDSVNGNGKTLKEYGDIIKDVCARYSIPVLDMWAESGLNPQLEAQADLFASDLIHPNAEGKAVMARRMIGWLKQLN